METLSEMIRKSRLVFLATAVLMALLAGCSSKPTDQGQQYKDGRLRQPLEQANHPNFIGYPVNRSDFSKQLTAVSINAPELMTQHKATLDAIQNWLKEGGDARQLQQFGLNVFQMKGNDDYGNVQLTGYYTPIIQARYTPQGKFRFPLYRMPPRSEGYPLPNRAAIYQGELDPRYIIGYSNSLIDNFMMEVQGSGYVNFGAGHPLTYFAYGGKNGHPYRSIGKILVERGEGKPNEMSMQAIRKWVAEHSVSEVRELLESNQSFVFFKPEKSTLVRGNSGVPLVEKASLAADRLLIPAGSTLLVEVPLLDNNGKFTGKHEMRIMMALDVGGAIKNQHLDIYQGIGEDAGYTAGFLNHYGRVWVLRSSTSDTI